MPHLAIGALFLLHHSKNGKISICWTPSHISGQLLSTFGIFWFTADVLCAAVPLAKFLAPNVHSIQFSLQQFARKQFGMDLHSLTAVILVEFKTACHWQTVTLVYGPYRFRIFSNHSSHAMFHDHQGYIIPCKHVGLSTSIHLQVWQLHSLCGREYVMVSQT